MDYTTYYPIEFMPLDKTMEITYVDDYGELLRIRALGEPKMPERAVMMYYGEFDMAPLPSALYGTNHDFDAVDPDFTSAVLKELLSRGRSGISLKLAQPIEQWRSKKSNIDFALETFDTLEKRLG